MRLIVLLLRRCRADVAGCDRQKADAPQAPCGRRTPRAPRASTAATRAQPAPAIKFKNPDGGDVRLAKFKGTPVLVNLWASWCAPCIKELPTLAAAGAAQADEGKLGIIAISQDMAPQGSVDAFLGASAGSAASPPFTTRTWSCPRALGVQIMPTTMLYDAAGKEVWRYIGDLDWTSAEAAKLLAEAK